jgi:hypothetical protein
VIVAVAPAGGVTVVGLTAQAGVEVVGCGEETWQVRLTVPVKLLTVPIVMLEEEVPPGATASGENGVACRVKSAWADVDESKVRTAVIPHKTKIMARPPRIFNWKFDDSDFNMSRFK